MEDSTRAEAAVIEFGDTTAMPMIADLAPVSCLLTDYATRERFLAELKPENRLIATEILQCATRLEDTTNWDGDTLIRFLGCPTKDIGSFRDSDKAQLGISRGYVRLLATLAETVETTFDKRMVVFGYGGVYLKAERDIDRVEGAFTERADEKDSLSASEYLELGEVRTALDTALRVIDPQHGFQGSTPFDGLPRVHISTGRLDVLVREDPEELATLGAEMVVPRMRTHIDDCKGCEKAFEDRRLRLEAAAAR
jgi:hypothetical protein